MKPSDAPADVLLNVDFKIRCVVQRVKNAEVTIHGNSQGRLNYGCMIFVGFAGNPWDAGFWDEQNQHTKSVIEAKIAKICKKIISLRLFSQGDGPMLLDAKSVGAGFYLVSQFTLFAQVNKGTRPSFSQATPSYKAKSLYNLFVSLFCSLAPDSSVFTGQFGEDMQITMTNDGPVTLILDSDGAHSL